MVILAYLNLSSRFGTDAYSFLNLFQDLTVTIFTMVSDMPVDNDRSACADFVNLEDLLTQFFECANGSRDACM